VHTTPRLLQGIFAFEGNGLGKPFPVHPSLRHVVAPGVVCQPVYFRGGNTAPELVSVVLMRDGAPMRYFPIGAKGDVHVPLRVVEDLEPGTTIEVQLAAPEGLTGWVVIDLGMVEF
jgi:assimilatory nitrate reductase catalytic subunit